MLGSCCTTEPVPNISGMDVVLMDENVRGVCVDLSAQSLKPVIISRDRNVTKITIPGSIFFVILEV